VIYADVFCEQAPRCREQTNGLGTMSSATPRLCAACAGGAASDSNSPKVHRRESCLASVQIKPVSTPMHAEVLYLLYLSDDVVSPYLPPHLAPGVRRYSAIAVLFVLEGRLSSLGYQFQVLSPTTRLRRRHQHTHVLEGGIEYMPSLPLFQTLQFS
jgi:hypothetical protein